MSGSSNPYSGPTGETTVSYTYGAGSAGPHAVTSLSNGNTYSYDANGNMTQRVEGSTTWNHTFNAENQLVTVSDGTTTTTYTYDHSGSRVRRSVTSGGVTTTTTYVAGMEIQQVGGTETQRTVYYSAGGAFRIVGGSNAGLYYRHTDHLGSTSVLSNASGAKVANSEIVYAPFGEVRTGSLPTLTDFGYTGQRHDTSTGGLMYYGARYYLPGLRRFISPDTIIPGTANPQAFNRYSYVLNRPINLSDPSGHVGATCPPGMDSTECAFVMHPHIAANPGFVVTTTTQGSTPAEVEALLAEGKKGDEIDLLDTPLDPPPPPGDPNRAGDIPPPSGPPCISSTCDPNAGGDLPDVTLPTQLPASTTNDDDTFRRHRTEVQSAIVLSANTVAIDSALVLAEIRLGQVALGCAVAQQYACTAAALSADLIVLVLGAFLTYNDLAYVAYVYDDMMDTEEGYDYFDPISWFPTLRDDR